MSQFYVSSSSGSLPPSVATSYVTDDGIAIPSGNILNVLGGDGIETKGSGDTITVNVINDGFPWTDEGSDFVALPQRGYFCTAGLTATLTSLLLQTGTTVIIYVDTVSPVIIQAAPGQQIEISGNLSTVGGAATSTGQGNIVQLVFRVSDQTWHSISSQGTFTLS